MAKIDWGEKLELKIRMLPESPGCYLMKDKDGTIIYVGKAVNLKNRVRSYFRDTEHTPKVAAMISHIDDFDILLCDSNLEALCLECNLIKLHKPYYNILLKDDKHYPYLRVNLKEPFPRLTLARRMEKDEGWTVARLRDRYGVSLNDGSTLFHDTYGTDDELIEIQTAYLNGDLQ